MTHVFIPSRRRCLALALAPAILACSVGACDLPSKPVGDLPDNPSGECVSGEPSALACYASSTDPYLELCDNPRGRDYWHVFLNSDETTAYMVPRPDELGLAYGVCDGDDPELAALFQDNMLCTIIDSAAKAEQINAMPVEDAMKISHALHERLEFTVAGDLEFGYDITPFAMPALLAEACESYPDQLAPIADTCERYIHEGSEPCPAIDLIYTPKTEQEATLLAQVLNDMYAVP